MMTAYDPWVNMLRSTVACFAAGIAGADAVTVLPYDHLRGAEATELGRRLGRNTQSILLEESHLAEVLDPAGGSWFVERYTDELAAAAWAWLQEIESAGGFRAAAADGLLAGADRRDPRGPPARHRHARRAADRPQRVPEHRRADPARHDGQAPTVRSPPHRWSEDLEALRRRVDDVAAGGTRPSVFLATIGPAAVFTPRVTFARNFFEVAGLATPTGPVTDDPGHDR